MSGVVQERVLVGYSKHQEGAKYKGWIIFAAKNYNLEHKLRIDLRRMGCDIRFNDDKDNTWDISNVSKEALKLLDPTWGKYAFWGLVPATE